MNSTAELCQLEVNLIPLEHVLWPQNPEQVEQGEQVRCRLGLQSRILHLQVSEFGLADASAAWQLGVLGMIHVFSYTCD